MLLSFVNAMQKGEGEGLQRVICKYAKTIQMHFKIHQTSQVVSHLKQEH